MRGREGGRVKHIDVIESRATDDHPEGRMVLCSYTSYEQICDIRELLAVQLKCCSIQTVRISTSM